MISQVSTLKRGNVLTKMYYCVDGDFSKEASDKRRAYWSARRALLLLGYDIVDVSTYITSGVNN